MRPPAGACAADARFSHSSQCTITAPVILGWIEQ